MRYNQKQDIAQLANRRRLARYALSALLGTVTVGLAGLTVLANPGSSPMLTTLDRQVTGNDSTMTPGTFSPLHTTETNSTYELRNAPAGTEEFDMPAPDTTDGDTSVAVNGVTVDLGDADANDIRWYDGRPIRPAATMRMLVTAYSPDERSCDDWADGYTASGYSVWTNGMKLVAADTSLLPFGSLVTVPGYDGGNVVPVLDRGGKIKGKRLDVLYPTHEIARRWGAQWLDVTIWEYADGQPAGFRTQHQNHPDYGKKRR